MRWPLVLVCVATTGARAEPPPLVLGADQVAVQVVAAASLAPGAFARPLSFAPDAWLGVSSRLTLGVIHSDPSIDRIAPKASVCVRQDALECPRFYRGSGIDVRYLALAGALTVVPHARVLLRDIAPLKPAVTLGAALRWRRGRVTLTTDPFLQLGVANTDRGNRSALWLPVVVTVAASDRIDAEVTSGWNSDIAVIRDGWHVPLEFAVRGQVSAQIDVRVGVGFTSLLGPQNTAKQRLLTVAVRWSDGF